MIPNDRTVIAISLDEKWLRWSNLECRSLRSDFIQQGQLLGDGMNDKKVISDGEVDAALRWRHDRYVEFLRFVVGEEVEGDLIREGIQVGEVGLAVEDDEGDLVAYFGIADDEGELSITSIADSDEVHSL